MMPVDYRDMMTAAALSQGLGGIASIFDYGSRRRQGLPTQGIPVMNPVPLMQIAQQIDKQDARAALGETIKNDSSLSDQQRQFLTQSIAAGEDGPVSAYTRSMFPASQQLDWWVTKDADGKLVPAPGAIDAFTARRDATTESPERVMQKSEARKIGANTPNATAYEVLNQEQVSAARSRGQLPYTMQEIGARGAEDRQTAGYRNELETGIVNYKTQMEGMASALRKLGDQAGGEAAGVFESAGQLPAQIDQLGRIGDLANGMIKAGIRPGMFAASKAGFSKALQESGLDPTSVGLPKDVSDYETFLTEARNQMGPIMQTLKLAPMTDSDRDMVERMTINPGDAPETIARKIEITASALQRTQQAADFLDQKINVEGVAPQQAMSELRRNRKITGIFTPEQRQVLRALKQAEPQSSGERKMPPATGMTQPATITNIFDRAILKNADGSISTTRSMSIGTAAGEVLIPTVVDGKSLTKEEAIARFRKTGEHLGIFDTPEHADAYAEALHDAQARSLGLPTGGQQPAGGGRVMRYNPETGALE